MGAASVGRGACCSAPMSTSRLRRGVGRGEMGLERCWVGMRVDEGRDGMRWECGRSECNGKKNELLIAM